MDEVADFEGFISDDSLASAKRKNIFMEQIAKKNSVSCRFSASEIKREKRRKYQKTYNQTFLLKYWNVKEKYVFDTLHPVHDHAQWFDEVKAEKVEKLQLPYHKFIKLVKLESHVNATMFINNCNEITTRCLWKKLDHQTKTRLSKLCLEKALTLSPLFSLGRHRKLWERLGFTHQEGKNIIYSSYETWVFSLSLLSVIVRVEDVTILQFCSIGQNKLSL